MGVLGTERSPDTHRSYAVKIRDVSPRDGLQSEQPVRPERRVELIERLIEAGLRDIEVASFVSPKAVPAMAGAADVVAALHERANDVTLWALVPNVKGAELATAAGVDHLTITVSASPAYSEKNTHRSIEQAFEGIVAIRAAAPRRGARRRDLVLLRLAVRRRGHHARRRLRARRPGTRRRRRPGDPRRHDRDGDAAPRQSRCSRRPGATSVCTSTTPGAPRCSTRGQRSSVASTASTRPSAVSAARRSRQRRAATWPPRISSWSSPTAGSTPGSTSTHCSTAGPLLADLVGHELPSRVAAAGSSRTCCAARSSGRRPTTPGRPRRWDASPRNRASTTSTP